MQVFRRADTDSIPADPKNFRGSARIHRIEASSDPHVLTFRVEFAPAARTNWHAHGFVQILLFVEGRGQVQKWGEAVQDVAVGETVVIAPGEKHWHGATPDSRMVHIAINLGTSTTWMEPVDE